MRKHTLLKSSLSVLALAAGLAVSANAGAAPGFGTPPPGTPGGSGPMVYVTGQDLVYGTIVLGALPFEGPFQKLEMDGPTGLQTEFGLGDPGYVGGRWWVDANDDGEMDDGDVYFLCPLLGPGQEPG